MKKKIDTRQQQQKAVILSHLQKTPIVQLVCEKSGVSRATYYRWRKEDPDFRKQSDKALLEGKHLMNDMAESQLLSSIKDKNLTAIIFWLKHHHKDYATRVKVSADIRSTDETLNEEQQAQLEQALTLIAPNLEENDT
jgi:hypothetical protein